ARQFWRAKRRVYPGFLRHMASRQPSLVHTAGVRSGSGQESVARKGDWRERLQLAGRRLQKSDLAAVGRRRREEEGRAVAGRPDLPKPVEPVLARIGTVSLQAQRHADAAAAGPDRDAVQRES